MAGYDRPKCDKCGKWYKFDWDKEKMVKNCSCKKDVDNEMGS